VKVFSVIKREFLHIYPLYLFFLASFTIINEIETFLFKRAGMPPATFINILIASGLISKIVSLMDQLAYTEKFRKRPLAIIIFWKTFNYWLILFVVRVLVRFVPYLFEIGLDLKLDFKKFTQELDLGLFLSIQVFYLLFLFIYVTFKEVTLKIGIQKMKKIFFGS